MNKDETQYIPQIDAELDLQIDDLALDEIRVLTEDNAAALPESGASVGWNSCTVVAALQ